MLAENLEILPCGSQDVTYTHVTHRAWALCRGASGNSGEMEFKDVYLGAKDV